MLSINFVPNYPRVNETIKDGVLSTVGIASAHLLSKKLVPLSFEKWTPSGYPLWVATATVGATLGRELFILLKNRNTNDESDVSSDDESDHESDKSITQNDLHCTGDDRTFKDISLHSLFQIGGIATAFFFMKSLMQSRRCGGYFPKYGSLSSLPIHFSVLLGSTIVAFRKLGIGNFDYDKQNKQKIEAEKTSLEIDKEVNTLKEEIKEKLKENKEEGKEPQLSEELNKQIDMTKEQMKKNSKEELKTSIKGLEEQIKEKLKENNGGNDVELSKELKESIKRLKDLGKKKSQYRGLES